MFFNSVQCDVFVVVFVKSKPFFNLLKRFVEIRTSQ